MQPLFLPCKIVLDNATEFKGKKWMSFVESLTISSAYTQAHHPNQNLAERCGGGALKAVTVHLLKITGALLAYWWFGLEDMCLV